MSRMLQRGSCLHVEMYVMLVAIQLLRQVPTECAKGDSFDSEVPSSSIAQTMEAAMAAVPTVDADDEEQVDTMTVAEPEMEVEDHQEEAVEIIAVDADESDRPQGTQADAKRGSKANPETSVKQSPTAPAPIFYGHDSGVRRGEADRSPFVL